MKPTELRIQSLAKILQPLFLVASVLAFSMTSRASNETVSQDREVMERAKTRKYRNGAEEGDLQVQGQVHKPQRKIAPVIEKKETETNQEHD
ncbi:MAG: hypothetical protein ACK5Y2_06670 [Bdellovibrionales bacterium]